RKNQKRRRGHWEDGRLCSIGVEIFRPRSNAGRKFRSVASTPVELFDYGRMVVRLGSKFSSHRLKNNQNNRERQLDKFDYGRNFHPWSSGGAATRVGIGTGGGG
ncbi:hypothetical protein TorRG33x02_144210, partial [Trema orientale]